MAGSTFIEANRITAVQVVATTAASATTTNPFGNECFAISLVGNTAFHFKVVEAAGGTAAITDMYQPANSVRTIRCTPGQKVSTIRAATAGLVTATDGSVWVAELSA